jgi:iron(III) transport system substrate-binding protein
MSPRVNLRDAARFAIRRAGALAVAASLLAAPASAAEPSLEETIAGARREGAIEIWVGSPSSNAVHRALLDAFQRRFAIETRWKWVVLHSMRSTTRLIAEAAVGRVSVDIITSTSDSMATLAERKLFRPYPWVEVFGNALPGIREPAQRVLPELRGLGLPWFDNVYVIAWNTELMDAAKVPRRLREFLDPRWKGRFALNVLSGAPLDLLSLEIGEEGALALAQELLANQPILKSGTPAVSSAITTGEAHFGISSFINVERARRKGEPQAYRFFEDYLPMMPLYISVPENAPHPNTARLFAAWLVTEGARITEKMDSSSRMSDPESALAKALKDVPATTAIVQERSLADVEKTRAISAKLNALFTGRRN